MTRTDDTKWLREIAYDLKRKYFMFDVDEMSILDEKQDYKEYNRASEVW